MNEKEVPSLAKKNEWPRGQNRAPSGKLIIDSFFFEGGKLKVELMEKLLPKWQLK